MALNQAELIHYSRQIALSDIGVDGQLKLKNAKVLCIGAGGLGAPLLQYLAAAGVGTIGIVDDDCVEASNLQRQIIYGYQDIGVQKTKAAKKRLHQINPHIQVNEHFEKFDPINAERLIAPYDIIADCTDQLITRYHLNQACLAVNKTFVFAGIWQYQGQCMLFNANDGPCFCCAFPPELLKNKLPDCNATGVLGVLPGLLGTIQANLIIQSILQIILPTPGRFLTLDLLSLSLNHYQIDKRTDCEMCGSGARWSSPTVNSITVMQLQTKIKRNDKFILLDVRTQRERDTYHIGGLFIPLSELPKRMLELNSDTSIITYCQSGTRSITAALMLIQHQFKSVAYLEGGISAFNNSGRSLAEFVILSAAKDLLNFPRQ